MIENGNPPDNGWWELINGAWRWMTSPTPVVVSQTATPDGGRHPQGIDAGPFITGEMTGSFHPPLNREDTGMFTDDRTDPPEGEEIWMPPPGDGPIEPGWWQLIAGTWQWVTSPTPKVISGT